MQEKWKGPNVRETKIEEESIDYASKMITPKSGSKKGTYKSFYAIILSVSIIYWLMINDLMIFVIYRKVIFCFWKSWVFVYKPNDCGFQLKSLNLPWHSGNYRVEGSI